MNFYKATLKLYLSFLHKEIIWYFLLIQKNENCNLIHGKYQTKYYIYKKANLNEGINTLSVNITSLILMLKFQRYL